MNETLRKLLGWEGFAADRAQIGGLLTPAAQIYYQVSMFPALRMGGELDEIYLALCHASGEAIPVLINARYRAEKACSDWAIVRIEQRGRWETELLAAKRLAEEESAAHARKSRELSEAKAALEKTLAELKESHWLLRKAAEVLPTCMYCKRVKGDQAQWESAIEYLQKSSTFLSHGCCPECTPKILRDFGFSP